MNNKIEIELTAKEAVFLVRLFQISYNSYEELSETAQFRYAMGKSFNGVVLSCPPNSELDVNEAFTIGICEKIEACLSKARIDFRRFSEEAPVMVGGHKVIFEKGKIKVGCTEVTNAQILEIAKRQKII